MVTPQSGIIRGGIVAYHILPEGSISSPSGYRATGIHAGLKPNRARDLALISSTQPCTTAAMFTSSVIKGAPVLFDQALLARNRDQIRAVLINSGIANVGLGRAGIEAATECARLVADELEIPADSVLLMSTGAIGVPLPMGQMRAGIRRAVSELDSAGGHRAALAILTTDQQPKEQAVSVQLRNDQEIVIAGMAKGGCRVHPNLATTLCLLTTDAALPAALLARSLRQAIDQSFHCITLDGDMSPNDSVILLANGAARTAPIAAASSWDYGAWQEALNALTRALARMVVEDGNNQPLLTLEICGARTDGEARLAGLALTRSLGVRQSWRQGLVDWAAIVAALGASGADIAAERLMLQCGDQPIAVDGQILQDTPAMLPSWNEQREIVLRLDLNRGDGRATIWTRA
ncbi:MAG: arginine biosynthesis bifunctional protein ArgJ [Herpetosiphonaceae bacterium]|nr:MAG: arginine biosynthesis bifunctional protein ArgJ [Herpetosiphonaceae bacterium]